MGCEVGTAARDRQCNDGGGGSIAFNDGVGLALVLTAAWEWMTAAVDFKTAAWEPLTAARDPLRIIGCIPELFF